MLAPLLSVWGDHRPDAPPPCDRLCPSQTFASTLRGFGLFAARLIDPRAQNVKAVFLFALDLALTLHLIFNLGS